eukprot:CAMPEP_0174830088 /NCGR_PEP_ID=MMETSP1114-20130205/2336_1 /TAXON_ID=312471 /ORGANISM="Neobodo designis, Strain CCAP 1951/1" /LENGTH=199 /DNA_ID=CAMNT_0016063873 /DNA_START=54 /DNA_END=653 /DNA_ORIENTATION=-
MLPPRLALYASILVLVVALGMLAGANGAVLLQHGFGASTTEIGIWRTCEALPEGGEKCYSVTSNSQCSELSSRMKAVGAFSILGAVSTVLTIAVFIAESRGATFPVNHLSKIVFAWAVVLTVVCISVSIGTLVASLCSDPLPMTDRNGSFGSAFYFLFAALVLQVLGGAAYAYFKLKNDVAGDNDADDDDDKDQGFADL